MAYTDNSAVQTFLQRTLTATELAALPSIISAVQDWIDRTLGTTFDQVAASTRLFDGGQRAIDIDHCTGITAIKAINDDGSDSYTYNDVSNFEVVVEPQNSNVKNELVKRFGRFPHGLNRIAVTAQFSEYDGGVPADIQQLATRLAGLLLAQGGAAGSVDGTVSKESLEGHSVEYKFGNEYTGQSFDGLSTSDKTVAAIIGARRELMADYSDDYPRRGDHYDDEGEHGLLV